MVSLSASMNTPAIAAYMRQADTLADALYRLASGNKLARATDRVGEVSFATQLQAQLSASRAALATSNKATSVLETAQEGLARIEGLLSGAKAVAEQADDVTLNATERVMLNRSFEELVAQANDVVESTTFDGSALLDGSAELSIAAGTGTNSAITLSIGDARSAALFEGATPNLMTQGAAASAVNVLSDALANLGNITAVVDTARQRISYAGDVLNQTIGGLRSAQSMVAETDVANDTMLLMSEMVRQRASALILAQTGGLRSSMLELVK